MIKAFLIPLFFLAFCAKGFSQVSQVEYLEITARYEDDAVDSTQKLVTYAVSIKDYNSADSLALSLSNEEGLIVYQAANSLGSWMSSYPHRMEGATLYLTIEAGSYAGLAQFEGKAHTLVNGSLVPGKSFIKETY